MGILCMCIYIIKYYTVQVTKFKEIQVTPRIISILNSTGLKSARLGSVYTVWMGKLCKMTIFIDYYSIELN